MSQIKVFKLGQSEVAELPSQTAKLERDLQFQVEQNMETFLGIRFLATEFTTSNGGRIDSLGIDEDGCPVILEYKRHINENVINQGLFYYDWLIDHKAEFQLLVLQRFGNKVSDEIEWDGARLVCIASDFTKFDEHAIKQIDKNIELMRYKYFGDDLLMFELINSQTSKKQKKTFSLRPSAPNNESAKPKQYKDNQERLESASASLTQLYKMICDYCESLGDDIQKKDLKQYTAFKRIKNFVTLHVLPQQKDERVVMYLNLKPASEELKKGFTHDVTGKGHWGTGDCYS
jgi:predicted transport protein